MKFEITAATDFLTDILRNQNSYKFSPDQLIVFRSALCHVMRLRYISHWYPVNPSKGSAYRCIRSSKKKLDPFLEVAANYADIDLNVLRFLMPGELTMWVDPGNVSVRLYFNGSIFVLYSQEQEWDALGLGDNLIEKLNMFRTCINDDVSPISFDKYKSNFIGF